MAKQTERPKGVAEGIQCVREIRTRNPYMLPPNTNRHNCRLPAIYRYCGQDLCERHYRQEMNQQARAKARQQDEIRRSHNRGAHDEAPDSRCDFCKAAPTCGRGC